MKKFFLVFGIVSACLIVIAGVIIFVVLRSGLKLDSESKAYVDRVVPLIITSWNSKDLLDNASPEFLKTVTSAEIDSMFKMLSEKLGKCKEYKGSKGDSNQSITSKEGMKTTAFYTANVVLEKADAVVSMRLVRHDGKWQVFQFSVNSKALLQSLEKK